MYNNSRPLKGLSNYPDKMDRVCVKGRLRGRIKYWEEIGVNATVGELISGGYRIPLISTPGEAHFENNYSALKNRDLVEEKLTDLLETGRVRELRTPPWVTNPLSVSVSADKKLLILDLTYVSFHVYKG